MLVNMPLASMQTAAAPPHLVQCAVVEVSCRHLVAALVDMVQVAQQHRHALHLHLQLLGESAGMMQLQSAVQEASHVAKLRGVLKQVDGNELLHPAHKGPKALRAVRCQRCCEALHLHLLQRQHVCDAQQHAADTGPSAERTKHETCREYA